MQVSELLAAAQRLLHWRHGLWIAVVSGGAALVSGCSRSELITGAGLVVLEGVTLIDGTGAEPRPGTSIVLEGGRIRAVGASRRFRFDETATVIDYSGKWVVPGFVDVHAHMPAEDQEQVLATVLAFGVTTAGSAGAPSRASGVDLRARIESGEVLGPRFLTAGYPIMGEPLSRRFMTEAAVRKEVARQADLGVDLIKVFATLPPDRVRVAIEEAHARGLKVLGHLGRTTWSEAAEAGIDRIAHSEVAGLANSIVPASEHDRFQDFYLLSPGFDPELFREWNRTVDPEGPEVSALARTLVEHEVSVNPTLAAVDAITLSTDGEGLARFHPEYAPASMRERWEGRPNPVSGSWSEDVMAAAAETFRINDQVVLRLHQLGVTLTAGSDQTSWRTVPGVALHRELQLLTEAGIPPLDVLRIATRNGAMALGLEAETGTIEVGKSADLLILDGDPLAELSSGLRIGVVYLRGHPYDPEELLRPYGLRPLR